MTGASGGSGSRLRPPFVLARLISLVSRACRAAPIVKGKPPASLWGNRPAGASLSRLCRTALNRIRTAVSVAGKRNIEGRDKEAETASKVQGRRCRDKISLSNPANSGLVAENREISVRARMRGGAERTRTGCQARSRYRTGLSRVIPPRQFCDQMSPISSNNIVQKGLAFGRHWSGTVR